MMKLRLYQNLLGLKPNDFPFPPRNQILQALPISVHAVAVL